MLRITPIVFLVLLIHFDLDAQKQFTPATNIGLNVSGSVNRVSFTPVINQKLLSSVSYGLVFRHESEPHIATQFEINYAVKGWIEDRDSIGTYTRELEVIEFPLMAVFVAGSKKLRLAVTVGPYISYLLDEKEEISVALPDNYRGYYSILGNNIPIVDNPNYQDYYLKPLERKWEFGFTGGVAVELHTKLGAFGIRGTYSNSMTNVFSLNSEDYYYSTSRLQTIRVGITYMVSL